MLTQFSRHKRGGAYKAMVEAGKAKEEETQKVMNDLGNRKASSGMLINFSYLLYQLQI